MDVKIGEQPNIKFQLQPAAPVTIRLETKYIKGGDSVTSDSVREIEVLTQSQYEGLVNTGKIDDNTLYIIKEDEIRVK